MASTLVEELLEEIFLRIPPNEPVRLARATLVCKAWRRIILSNDGGGGFLRRYRRFHGAPPLLGYICSHYDLAGARFVPTTTSIAASTVRVPTFDFDDCYSTSAMDCRHGRVLIQEPGLLVEKKRFLVWDPVTGDQQHLTVPDHLHQFSWPHHYAGAVLCANRDDGGGCDDNLVCHGGPFLVALVGSRFDNSDDDARTWAAVYSSGTKAWSAPTHIDIRNLFADDERPNLFIGNSLYFTTKWGKCNIVKYDLCNNELFVMDLPPGEFSPSPILIKGDDGRLGLAAMLHNSIHMWSWRQQAGIHGVVGEWVKYRVTEFDDTPLPEGGRDLLCMVDGTDTVFIGIGGGIFTLDLKSRQVRKIGERESSYDRSILPYMCFYAPKY